MYGTRYGGCYLPWLACLLAALAGTGRGAAQDRRAVPPRGAVAVLLYDGRYAEHVELETMIRQAMAPHARRLPLRTMHAGRAETVPFLRAQRLTREAAPLLLLMDGPAPGARVLKRQRLRATDHPEDNTLVALRVFGLPTTGLPEPPRGTLLSVQADGTAPELAALRGGAGTLVDSEERARRIPPGAAATYLLRLPAGVRNADLILEIGGEYQVAWASAEAGPWNALPGSAEALGPAQGALRDRYRPVVDLAPALRGPAGSLFLRITGRGSGALLARLELHGRARGEPSGAEGWREEAERLRREALGTAATPGPADGTPLGGTLEGAVTLEAARSPYLLTADLTIAPTAVVTVEPGVMVRILGPRRVTVHGLLLARGTPQRPISVVPALRGGPGNWRGIRFFPSAFAHRRGGSVLAFCRVVQAEAVSFGGPGLVERCVFEEAVAGITLTPYPGGGPAAEVRHCRFLRCSRGVALGVPAVLIGNEVQDCEVGFFLEPGAFPPGAAAAAGPAREGGELRILENSLKGCRVAAVLLLRDPARPEMAPVMLPGNHWDGEPRQPRAAGAPVSLEPRLPAPPEGVGPGWTPSRDERAGA